ncbi:histone-lysine N-methyltransferase SUV39H1-like isoform X1, partial [Dinothrombium tinctorium]
MNGSEERVIVENEVMGNAQEVDNGESESEQSIEQQNNHLSIEMINCGENQFDMFSSRESVLKLFPFDDHAYSLLKRKAEDSSIVLPAIESFEQLKTHCESIGVRADLTIPRIRHFRDVKYLNNVPKTQGQQVFTQNVKKKVKYNVYEVEAIVDYNETDKKYLVKWKDWDEEFNTWEPLSHLTDCLEMVQDFEARSKQDIDVRKNAYTSLIKLRLVIEQITNKKYKDPAVLLKLCNMRLRDYKHSDHNLTQLRKLVSEKSKMLMEIIQDNFIDMRCAPLRVLKSVVAKLNINASFNNLEDFFDFVENRKKIFPMIKEWEDEVNRTIEEEGIHAPITIENFVDTEGPPKNFVYVTKCRVSDGIIDQITEDPVMWCECDDCFENKKACCPKNMDALFAYTRESILRENSRRNIVECNRKCRCGPECPNRVIQKGTKFKLKIFRTDNGCGWGVRTMERILKGRFVMEYVGEIIHVEEADKRGKEYDAEGRTYLFDLDFDAEQDCAYVIDAAHYGNIAHFVNHSCDPNLEVFVAWIENQDPRLPRITFFSRRQIKAGEELTFDYRMTRPEGQNLDLNEIIATEKLFSGINFQNEDTTEENSKRVAC